MNKQVNEIDYLELIEQGVEDWNRWRAEHPDLQPDLSRVYLLEADLSGANLSGVNLSSACLIDTNLKAANLQGANLQGAYGNRANLELANLHQADLSQANFSEANLARANLSQTKVARVNFSSADLTGICLENWQLDGATDFSDAKCTYVYLKSPQTDRHPDGSDFSPETFNDFLAQQRSTAAPSTAASIDTLFNIGDTTTLPSPARSQQAAPKPRLSLLQHPQQWPLVMKGGLLAVGLLGLGIAISLRSRPQAPPQISLNNIDLDSLPCREPPPPVLSNQQPSHRYSNGIEYYGQFAGGAPVDGYGVMLFTNGDRYDGEFKNGDRNGCGTFTFANGRQYMGQFSNDQFNGVGVWQLETGDRYVGQFRNSKCHGWGTFLAIDGSSKSGTWEDGNLVGDTLTCNRDTPQSP